MPDNYGWKFYPEDEIQAVVDEIQRRVEMTDEILDFAGEIFNKVMTELQGGDWRERFEAYTDQEKAMLFLALADAFNDTTEE